MGPGAPLVSSPGERERERARDRKGGHRGQVPAVSLIACVVLGRTPHFYVSLPGWRFQFHPTLEFQDINASCVFSFFPRPQVLVYELLLGRGFRGGGGRWKPLLDRHQARLKAELARLKVQRRVSRNEDLLQVGSRPGAGEL